MKEDVTILDEVREFLLGNADLMGDHMNYPSKAIITKAKEMAEDTCVDLNPPTIACALLDTLEILDQHQAVLGGAFNYLESMVNALPKDDSWRQGAERFMDAHSRLLKETWEALKDYGDAEDKDQQG